MIIVKDLSKSFGDKVLLNNFSYKFNDTGYYLIKGVNGSGKTTLLNMISGLVKPDSGNIYYNNTLCNEKVYEYLRREEYSYIFQNLNLVGSLTVKDNLKIGYLSVNESLDGFELKAKEVLEKVFLGDRFVQKVKYLSGGEKQRITIARALLKDAKVILADEPCASLDVENAQLVYKSLEDLSKDHLVIVVSHDDDYIQECEKNGNITIIDMNDKDKYINNYEVCESSIDIKEKKVSHTNFLSKSLFSNIKLLSIFLCLINSILIAFVMLSFNYNEYSHEFAINYAKDCGINSVLVSSQKDDFKEVYSNIDNEYINELYSSSCSISTLEAYNDESEDSLDIDENLYVYLNYAFSNILIDNNLENFHISITRILYDYLYHYGYISNNQINLYYCTLYIDNIIERDYSYLGSSLSDIDKFNLNYFLKAIYANSVTKDFILKYPPYFIEILRKYSFSLPNFNTAVYISSRQALKFKIKDIPELKLSNTDDFELEDDEIIMPFYTGDEELSSFVGQTVELTVGDYYTKTFTIKDFSSRGYIILPDSCYLEFYYAYLDYLKEQGEYSEQEASYIIETESADSSKVSKYLKENNLYVYYPGSASVYSNLDIINLNFSFLFLFKSYSIALLCAVNVLIVCIYITSSIKNVALMSSLGYRDSDIYKFKNIHYFKQIIVSFLISFFIFVPIAYYYKNAIEQTIDYMLEIDLFIPLSFIMGIVATVISILISLVLFRFKPNNIYSKLRGE